MSDADCSYSHQDWTPVKIQKRYTVTTAQQEGKSVETTSKTNNQKVGKSLERDLYVSATEEAPVLKALPKLSQEDRQMMIQARVAKKLSQVDLARQVNLPLQVIQTMETGKIIENKQAVQLVNRILGTKLKIAK
jgi:putative transcription factor